MAQLVHELVEDGAACLQNATALRHGDRRVGFAALFDMVESAAAALRASGIVAGETVAVALPPTPTALAALLGASAAHGAFVAVDPALPLAQRLAMLRDSGARVLVTGPLAPPDIDAHARACPALRTVLVQGEAAPAAPATTGTLRILAWEGLTRRPAPPLPVPVPSALAALVYGGDAVPPRALALSHGQLVAGAASTARCLAMVPGDRMLCALPPHTDHGLNALLACLAAGATAVLAESPTPAVLARLLERGELTGLMAPAPLLAQLAAMPLRGAAPCLRFLACVGAPPAPEALAALRRTLPRTRIQLWSDVGDARRALGLTPAELAERPGSIGRPLPYSEWLLLRPDGTPCGPAEPGELVRRGSIALGYWNDPLASAARLRDLPAPASGLASDSGYWSGVRARSDADGFVYPLEGHNELIVTGGHRVKPREVEEIVVGTGLVAEAAP